MKFLGFFMLLFNIVGFIGMCVAMSQGVMPGFAVFLGVLTMILQIGIIGGVGRWFVDTKQIASLVRGLMANLGQTILNTIVLAMNASAVIAAAVEHAQEISPDDPRYQDAQDAARLLEDAGLGFVLIPNILFIILAAYFVHEGREYKAKAEKLDSFSKV